MNTIITIGRQFGSGGREIGEKLAEHFGIKCYDKELLSRAAKESGFCEEMIQNHDERPTNSFLYNLVMDTYSFGYNASSFVDMPISHKVFLAQFDTIKKIADEGPCVIVGRCANYILRGRDNVMNVFVTAPVVDCVRRVMETDGLDLEEAEKRIRKTDKRRADYFKYFTGREWQDAALYDLCLNTGHMSEQKCLSIVKAYMEARFDE